MAAADAIVLYGTKLCPFVQRTRMLLHHKQLAFKDTTVDLLHKPEWFKVGACGAALRVGQVGLNRAALGGAAGPLAVRQGARAGARQEHRV
jgi:hypothetical protein